MIVYLKELSRRRFLVLAAVVAAAAISLFAVFNVSLAPPSIAKRDQISAQGSIEILVDSSRSPIADAKKSITGLTARAGVFARYMAGGRVIGLMAKKSGIPVKQIDVASPAPLPGEAPGAGQPSPQIHPYGVDIEQAAELPIVSVVTRAPTVGKARALAAAAPGSVRQVVDSIQKQQGTPDDKRVEFRVLGPAKAAKVDNSVGKKVAIGLFFVLVAIFIALIIGVPRLIAAWRSGEPEALQAFDEGQTSGEVPEVLRLPLTGDADPGAEQARVLEPGESP